MRIKPNWTPLSDAAVYHYGMADLHMKMKGLDALDRAEYHAVIADQKVWQRWGVKAWDDYLSTGDENPVNDMQRKALHTNRDEAGGFGAAGPSVAEYMATPLSDLDDVRSLASIAQVIVGDTLKHVKGTGHPGTAWRRQTDLHTPTADITMAAEMIPTHDLVCTIVLSRKMWEDVGGQAIAQEAAGAFRVNEGIAFLNGTGVGQPEGLLTNGNIAAINGGDASLLTYDGLVTLTGALSGLYWNTATLAMNSNTLATVRKLKDSNGQPVLKDPAFGQPPTIFGRPVAIFPHMPDIASGTTPIIFGDFSYYMIADRTPLALLIDQYSGKPSVIFDFVRRIGGQAINGAAFKKLLIAV